MVDSYVNKNKSGFFKFYKQLIKHTMMKPIRIKKYNIVNSGKWPCGVGGKGVHANFQCAVCIQSVYKWCSGVPGDLSMVDDVFRCKPCDGGPSVGWKDIWMCKELLLSGRHS